MNEGSVTIRCYKARRFLFHDLLILIKVVRVGRNKRGKSFIFGCFKSEENKSR